MTIWCRSHDQLLPKGENYDDSAQEFTVPIKNGFNLTAVIAGAQEQTEHVPLVPLVFRLTRVSLLACTTLHYSLPP
jgi:hypothetical protein